jgi:Concanavalin A-like lectin/glucanases superfamily
MKKYFLILLIIITNQFLSAQITPSLHGFFSKIHERPKPTNSIYFDGINQQYLQISNSGLNFNAAGDFTFETWIKFTTFNYSGQRFAPVFGGNQYNYISVDGQQVNNRINALGVCSGDHVVSNNLQTNKWYHCSGKRNYQRLC